MAVLENNNKVYLIIKKDCIACNIQLHLLENAICSFNKNISDENNLINLDIKSVESKNIPHFIQHCNIKFTETPITIFTIANIVCDIIYGTETVEKLQETLNTCYK